MKIKVYSTETCSNCDLIKKLLKKSGKEFQDIDINNIDIRELVKKSNKMMLPIIEIDEEYFTFLEAMEKLKLKELLSD